MHLWQEVMCLSLFAWVPQCHGVLSTCWSNTWDGEFLQQSWPRLSLCDLWSQDAVFALINVSLELRFVGKRRHRWNPYVQKHIPAPAEIHVYNTSPSHVRVNSSSWIDFNVFSREMLSNALNTTISLSTLVLLHTYSWLWCQHHELTCFLFVSVHDFRTWDIKDPKQKTSKCDILSMMCAIAHVCSECFLVLWNHQEFTHHGCPFSTQRLPIQSITTTQLFFWMRVVL